MREEFGGFTYMLASRPYGTIYTGSARNLIQRVAQHRRGELAHFTAKHGVHTLVWFEAHESVASAYAREKSLKRWRRDWKIALIEESNPRWEDLYPALASFGAQPG